MFGYELLLMTFIFCIMCVLVITSILIIIGFSRIAIINKIKRFLEEKNGRDNTNN